MKNKIRAVLSSSKLTKNTDSANVIRGYRLVMPKYK